MDRETYSGREFTGDVGEYNVEKEYPDRDTGHIREMVAALEENTERLVKAMEGLGSAIEPVLRPSDDGSAEDESVPTPIRCALADDLARINEKIHRMVDRVQRKRDRVDI